MSSTLERPPEMDRRIAARRQTVREAGARRRLKWLLLILGVAGGGALVAWLLYHSSLLAVSAITVDGQHRSQADSIIAAHGVVPGMPTIDVAADGLEDALLGDPWIAAVDVTVRWPGTVEVIVVEHVPAAWVRVGDAWALAARGGAVVETADTIPSEAPRIDVATAAIGPGESFAAPAAVGGLEFVDALPTRLVREVVVEGDDTGLRAVVAGFTIDLGYPSDMAAKAAAVVAVLDAHEIVPGSTISVVSPQRPAVLPPPAITDAAREEDRDGAGADGAGAEGDESAGSEPAAPESEG